MEREGKAVTRQGKGPGENDIEWKESPRLLDPKGPCHSAGKTPRNQLSSTCLCQYSLETLGSPFQLDFNIYDFPNRWRLLL